MTTLARSRTTYLLYFPLLTGLIFPQNMLAASGASSVPLPTGGVFTAGTGNIATSGKSLTINQNSLKGIIDWKTFSIGQNASVKFNNGSGATLNRVTGSTPSSILGQLLATGNIYIINPEGVLIGHGATIHTGGDFLATTLNLSTSSFLSGGPLNLSGASTATVINLGNISSGGGNVYLIGRGVQNGGSINAPNGTAALAAGSQVLLTDSSTTQKVSVQAPGGDVTNSAFISAAQVELKSNGGNIYALAGNSGGQINATGTATQGGHVWLIATKGTTNVSGLISAANANGTGGSIETSGAQVITNGAQLKTGKGGSWLLDPDDLTIDSVLAGTIETSLNGGTNVTEQTTASGTGGSGDIFVNSPITWASGADLTLSAYRNIALNAGISNTGSGNLTLRADNTSIGTGTISGSGVVDFSGSSGNVALLYNPSSYASPTSYSGNFGSVNGSWTAPSDGSVSSQYTAYMLVNNSTDLQNISTNLSGTYALGTDVNLSSISNWTPLAPNYPYFEGILDGMGHTLSNLTINTSSTVSSYFGLFGGIGGGGQVRNLNMTGVSITTTGGSEYSGAVAGYMGGTVSNVSVSGIIHTSASPEEVGGLVGEDDGFIQNSNSSITIDGSLDTNPGYLGGLIGYSEDLVVLNSYATGSVSALNSNGSLGGLAGGSEAPITSSYATGSVTGGASANVGGLVGAAYYTTITGSHATGSVAGGASSRVGGLIGSNYYPVTNSYATGSVTGGDDSQVGGLAGYNSAAITTSYATGNVIAGNYISVGANAGGLVGFNDTGGAISNSYATGPVLIGSGTITNAGGLVGSDGASINSSYATGTVSGGGTNVGGLVGFNNSGSPIASSYATGSVASSGNNAHIGGLVGISNSAISASYANGAVSSTSDYGWLGGLVGYAIAGAISDSYATGSVTATGSSTYVAGGLVGYSSIGITNSYATGAVSADLNSNYVGGLVGWTDGAVSGSYATGSVSGGTYTLVGGLAGGNSTTISNSYAIGPVTGGDYANVGGLVGYANGPISVSYANGSATGGANSVVGGLVGYTNVPIADTYARGQVTGGSGSMAGGLIGQLDSGGSLATSYSSGLVSATGATVGGLIGNNTSGSTITSAYWDNESSGFLTTGVGSGNSSNVTGKTTAELQSGSLPGGFNSTNTVWIAPVGAYPYFGWQGSLVSVSGVASNGPNLLNGAGVSVLWQGTVIGSAVTQSNGAYDLLIPQNMTTGGLLSYLTSGGAANAFSDGATPAGFNAMDLANGQMLIVNGLSANMSSLSATLASALGSNSGANFVFGVPGGQLNLKSGVGLTLLSYPNFTIDQPLTVPGNLLLGTLQNLTIANGNPITAGSGSNITIAVGVGETGIFTNQAGSAALSVSGGGTWLVYSQNPANDTLDGLTPAFKQYNASFGATPAQSGDGLLYVVAPVITAALTGTASKTYDGATSASLTSANFTSTGAINGDTVNLTTPTSGTYASSNVGAGISVSASGLAVASASNGGIPVYGYEVAEGPATGNIGAITPATLTYTASPAGQTYGSSNSTFSGTISGFVNSETLASATTGTAAFTSAVSALSNVGSYAINGSGLTANNGNYVFTQAEGNSSALTINPATLTYIADPFTRGYGSSNPTFTGSVIGFVNGQTLAGATTGTAAFTSAAGTTSAAGSYAINGSGLAANHGNYVFTQAPGNAAALTVTSAVPPTNPTPPTGGTVLTFAIVDTSGLQNSNPTFSAAYTGPAIDGLNTAAILAGLTFTVSPTISGPGIYKITAAGTAPNGYALNITPGTLTIVASSPQVLPTQVTIIPPVLPQLLPTAADDNVTTLLQPPNAIGLFHIDVSSTGNNAGSPFIGLGTQQPALVESLFFGPNDRRSNYTTGAKP